MDIFTAHEKIKKKSISPLELVQESLKLASSSNNNTYVSLLSDQALKEAKDKTEKFEKLGPQTYIDGIPFSLKDLFITKNIRTTGGSHILYNYIPPYDGYVSKSLTKDGGILIGKVGCDEFGMGSTNENTAYGPVKNPLNNDYVAGGSSGGSAASVSEGSSFFSIGTDTGGSIRLPANFCGVTSLKPTYGRVSRYGQLAFGSSLDQASPIAKNTLDLACIMESITSHDNRDSTCAPLPPLKVAEEVSGINATFLKGKKIGYVPAFIESCEDGVKKSLNDALLRMKNAGAQLVEVGLENFKYSVSTYYIIATSEASSNLARYDGIHYGLRVSHKGDLEDTYVKSRTEGFGDEVKRRILLGTYSLSSGFYDAYYRKACKVRRLIYNDAMNAFKKCDVIFSPVCVTNAFKFGEGSDDPVKMYMNDLYTIPVNLTGLPAIALPWGESEGMPTGFQLIGQSFQERDLLKMGRAFELIG